jgi:hypothetical protein
LRAERSNPEIEGVAELAAPRSSPRLEEFHVVQSPRLCRQLLTIVV